MDTKVKTYAGFCTELNDSVAILTTSAHTITTADPDKLNWGHIGSMGHLLDQLAEAMETARQLAAAITKLDA